MYSKKILVVDNDKDFLKELEEVLMFSGYQVIAMDNSSAVAGIVDKVSVDLVLMDLQMPGKTGFELAYELRDLPRFYDVPIIAMTGFYREEYEPLLKACGISYCLQKPFHPLDVIAKVEGILAKHPSKASSMS